MRGLRKEKGMEKDIRECERRRKRKGERGDKKIRGRERGGKGD